MVFNTTLFLLFFLVFYAVYWFGAVTRSQRLWVIIVGSLLFYGHWDYRYVPLLVGTGLVDFFLARAIYNAPTRRRKALLLALSVGMNLGVLAVFKYIDFFFGTVTSVLGWFGSDARLPTFGIIVPVALSFYTFQSISYTVDVYRGTFVPRKRIHEFFAALVFFPHLVAGPIVRSAFFVPQFETLRPQVWEAARRGFLLIALGLCKKTLADLVGMTTDGVFGASHDLSFTEAWSGALAFTAQVYGDFSGYSDIAIGLALLLGFQLPENFRLPYLAASPIEFWHRWHISFSTWLRDYLWLPLSAWNTRIPLLNILVTMVLGGLWHGARWTFVVWGLFHGVLLVANHALRALAPTATRSPVVVIAKIAGTFYLIVVGWVLFRATSLDNAFDVLRGMHAPLAGLGASAVSLISVVHVAVALVVMVTVDVIATRWHGRPVSGWRYWPLIVVALMFSLMFGGANRAFIYFQF